MRPLLLLDVDGPLNPFRAPWFGQRRPHDGYEFHVLTPAGGRSYWVALNAEHGEHLRALAARYDLAWATTWRDDANRLIAPLLGLPGDLPVVPLTLPTMLIPGWGWKTEQIASWVGPRPFVWLDDEITGETQGWLDHANGLGPHLARCVPAEVGLTRTDFEAVGAFAGASG